ncbi:TetR/AcrR family transcriptional regulator [Allosphingosinicella sp.]|uniref:TetR/AcrR family transcriptional regulator n=1 Tax=Allosphingosinicella sp. TaxID=2823234 RepID=UPI0037845978
MSNSSISAQRKRPYRLGQRAAKQEETRRRIVEAAVDLHSSLGPARTTIAQIAEKAGVQRHTYYAHFPDERDLFMACSGLALERAPLPDVESWAALPAGGARLRHGLGQLYDWYQRNAAMTACVLRDAEVHKLTGEIAALRMAPTFARAAELLGEGLSARARALLGVAIGFGCWRTLAESGAAADAAGLMTDAILAL